MTFTYALNSTNETTVLISEVRLELGDSVYNQGVKPDNTNLQDEEIQKWLTDEGNDVMLACIRACGALARMWAKVTDLSEGGRSESGSKISAMWAAMRDDLIKQYGTPSTMTGGSFSVSPIKADGYHVHSADWTEYTYLDDYDMD